MAILIPRHGTLAVGRLVGCGGGGTTPLAGLLFFIGTLFPVLGFLNVYPFVFAFVADHYQYLASLGIITLTAAGAALLLGRWGLWHRPAGNLLCLALLAILGTASWRQSWMYTDLETLYRVTMDRDPECWVAAYNLGTFLSHAGRLTEAIAQFRRRRDQTRLRPGVQQSRLCGSPSWAGSTRP